MATIDDKHEEPYRELAYRANDGLEVVLFWHQVTNELMVTVSDERTGAYFELAADPDKALDVFDHPYAYAASIGLPYEEAELPNWALAVPDFPPAGALRSEDPTTSLPHQDDC